MLAAATSGMVIDGVTLTPVAAFRSSYRTILQTLAGTGAGIVVANIPDVTSIPFVTTIDPFLENPAGGAPIFLLADDGAGGTAPLGPDDRVLLPASSLLAQGIGIPVAAGGTGQPLPGSVVLDAAEVAAILERTGELNGVIADEAAAVGAAVVPVNAIFNDIAANGVQIGGVNFSEAYLTGGLFSYDGVHPSATAHALVANAFIDAINARFDADIPPVSLLPYAFEGVGAPDNDTGQVPTAANVIYTLGARDRVLEAVGSPSIFELEQIASGTIPAPNALPGRFDAGAAPGVRGGKRPAR